MILGILILAFILWLSLGFGKEAESSAKKPEKVCPAHRWEYYKPYADSEDEQLRCLICSKTPTEIMNEGGSRE